MLKNMTNKEKLVLLNPWLPSLIYAVKKDLKNDHLKRDIPFTEKYFAGKYLLKLTAEDLVNGYITALGQEENAEKIFEFICNRWLLKNGEIYTFFEYELRRITPDFSDLEELENDKAVPLMEASIANFGAPRTYLFSVLNSVVFPKNIYDQLEARAALELPKQNVKHG